MLAITPLGELTARALSASYPREGTPVGDARGSVHGRVGRVFGPVDHPYFTVRLRRALRPQEGAALVGTALVEE